MPPPRGRRLRKPRRSRPRRPGAAAAAAAAGTRSRWTRRSRGRAGSTCRAGTRRRTTHATPRPGYGALVTHPQVAVLDLDGTLVDSVYVHAVAWREAFREVGLVVPTYRL